MRKSILYFLLSLVLLPPAAAAQSRPNPKLPFTGTALNAPATYRYTLAESANGSQIQSYWVCKGFTKWSDGTETQNFEYRSPYYTQKERRAKRKKALTACENWLDKPTE